MVNSKMSKLRMRCPQCGMSIVAKTQEEFEKKMKEHSKKHE